ncbi:fungal-specific transcription factor domain-containing protein [Pyrenochaeta sp. MPI-SDFR-AT-0127]|nr:fungal-specific transcription factor domain-containing protein [Pyrenochaeta sp. MPI-SDFR-AT-0127]
MTRPKVPPEQRQRTAQACESCKRRKQKCNGLCPCNTCDKRKFTCIYSDRDPASPNDGRPPAKKRAIEESESGSPFVNDNSTTNTPSNGHNQPSPLSPHTRRSSAGQRPNLATHPLSVKQETPFKSPGPRPTIELTGSSLQNSTSHTNGELRPIVSRGTTVNSGPDEEAVIYSQSRMLQDPTGRVLYIGDSATLSFLQLLRMMVETVAGSSPFTTDPRRHKIVEGQYSLPPGYRHTHLLPDLQTARVLVDAFFINTHGLLQVFERDRFLETLERCFSDPLSVEPSWLCLLNLVFAIGLTMANPLSGSPEALTIDKLRSEHLDRAEVFYLNAKSLNDPMNGLEDQDFWSVQALLLMSVYMLAKSKRNTAFALLGMAARSAHALGLHREETMVIFSLEEQTERKNLWRSIFVFDRLLSCSLGRPTAISEDDCSGDALRPPNQHLEQPFDTSIHSVSDYNTTGPYALEAAVRSCAVIGIILRKVYQQRKISTRLAQEIADVCKSWPRALPSILHWRQAANASPSQGVAILHVNLFYCHSIILLTRPFFLYILNLETQRHVNQTQPGTRGPRPYLRMEKFSEACVIASTHTILLVQNAFDAGYLSRRNPAVIYFLFAATLVILANEFSGLYRVEASDTCILNAVNIMNYCAESDQQASRLVYILSTFRDVVAQQRLRRKQGQTDNATLPSIASQLYGVSMPNEHQQQQIPNIGGLANSTDPLNATPRLHQVPIHIYPGMQTSPLNDSTSSFQRPNQQPPHLSHQHSQPPTDFSVHLSPINDPPTSTSSDPFATATSTNAFNTPSKPPSLSMMLDYSALDATRVPSLHSEESGQDEQIDFDALWAWPSNTPAMGSPRPGMESIVGGIAERAQGISDSAVPLFGVSREGSGHGQDS